MTDTTNRDAFRAKVAEATDTTELQAAVSAYAAAEGKRLPTVAEVTLGYSLALTDIFGKEFATTITVEAARTTRKLMAQADAKNAEAHAPVERRETFVTPTQGPADPLPRSWT